MIRRLLFAWSARLPCRLINDGERRYLERYYLGSAFGCTVYLHRFVDSDPDRGLHDHPWPWALSFILSGWYWEQRRAGTRAEVRAEDARLCRDVARNCGHFNLHMQDGANECADAVEAAAKEEADEPR